MTRRIRPVSPFVLALSLAACSPVSSVRQESGVLRSQPGVTVANNVTASAETLGGAGALLLFGHPVEALGLTGQIFSAKESALLYIIYDPLAPNWTIKENPLDDGKYHLSMRAKSFRTGGDGESMQILKRRAQQLQREKGFTDYQILDFSEGIESGTPFTHRVSEGTVLLVGARQKP